MLNRLAELVGSKAHVQGTVPHLCTEFKLHKLAKYGRETQEQYTRLFNVIADEFDAFLVVEVTTKDFADFLRKKFADKRTRPTSMATWPASCFATLCQASACAKTTRSPS